MKNIFFFFVLFVIPFVSSGQIISDKKFVELSDRNISAGRNLSETPAIGESGSVIMSSPNIPISFSRLEKTDADKWKVGATLSAGASYSWIFGRATQLANNQIDVEPHFILGVTGNFGVVQNKDNTDVEPSLTLGAMIGFSKFSAHLGYDLLTSSPVLGVGVRIDSFLFSSKSIHVYKFKK